MRYMLSFQCESHEEAQAVLSAVAAIGKQPHACSKQYVPPEEILKNTLEEASSIAKETVRIFNEIPAERKNINPGDPTITKIGSGTKEVILDALRQGQQMPRPKYEEHLRLLWKRGEIKFNGRDFYV